MEKQEKKKVVAKKTTKVSDKPNEPKDKVKHEVKNTPTKKPEVTDMNKEKLTKAEKKKLKKEMDPKLRRKKRIKLAVWITLGVILLAVIGVGIYVNVFVNSITDDGNIFGLLFADANAPLEQDENGRTNILVFGTEGYDMENPNYNGGYLTDSMLLLSFDQETGELDAISMARDLKYPTCTATSKFNEIYYCNSDKAKNEKAGATALANAFTDVLGLDVHYWVHMNWQGFVEIIDAIGGIDVVFVYGDQKWDGPETTIKTTSPNGLGDMNSKGKYRFQYKNGVPYHLNGAEALAVARTRNSKGGYGAKEGTFSRDYFQQRIIEATIKQAKKKGTLSDLTTLLRIKNAIGDNLRTSFKDTDIKILLRIASEVDFSNVKNVYLNRKREDGGRALLTTGMVNNISYVLPSAGVDNYTEIREYLKEYFAKPEVEEPEEEAEDGETQKQE